MTGIHPQHNQVFAAICLVLVGIVIASGVFVFLQHTESRVIYTDNAPKPIGPYNQGIESGGFIFLSGQIGLDPKTGNLSDTISGQTEQIMKNLQAVLAESSLDFTDVVQSRIYLTNLSDFSTVNEIYGGYLGSVNPSRSTVQVAGLPKGALVEIEMIAHRNNHH